MIRSRFLLLFFGVSSVVVGGCATKRDDGMTGTDAGPTDSGPPPGPSFEVLVVDTEDGMPINSATVTLDLPGRPRMELTTGPDGRASFAGVDPEANAPTVTAYRTGRRLITYASVDML